MVPSNKGWAHYSPHTNSHSRCMCRSGTYAWDVTPRRMCRSGTRAWDAWNGMGLYGMTQDASASKQHLQLIASITAQTRESPRTLAIRSLQLWIRPRLHTAGRPTHGRVALVERSESRPRSHVRHDPTQTHIHIHTSISHVVVPSPEPYASRPPRRPHEWPHE